MRFNLKTEFVGYAIIVLFTAVVSLGLVGGLIGLNYFRPWVDLPNNNKRLNKSIIER